MRTNIQFRDMPVSEALSTRINSNLDKLAGKYPWIIGAEVTIKQENNPRESNCICEIQLSAPGPYLFARSCQDNFEKAARIAVNELSTQLEKRKNQILNH